MFFKIKSGFLISIEGIDGSGKSTLSRVLKELLESQNYSVILTKEPGGTPLGLQIRNFLQNRTFDICDKAEFLLFASDRAQHMAQKIAPALQNGQIVISDRMGDSSLAYQGFGRGLDKEFINQVNIWAMCNRVPDLTIYLRIDYQIAFERFKRREQTTAFEQEKSEFFKRVIEGFETIFRDRKETLGDNSVIIVDASQSFEQVKLQITNQILKIFENLKAA